MSDPISPQITTPDAPHWTARHGKPIIFVIVTLIAVGAYLALTIPVSVFPETNFPRVVVGIDNGVFPHRPDAGHGHPAYRRSRQLRAGPGASVERHQPRHGGSGPVLFLERGYVPH